KPPARALPTDRPQASGQDTIASTPDGLPLFRHIIRGRARRGQRTLRMLRLLTPQRYVIGVIGCQADRRGSYNDHRELAGRASSASEHGLVDRALNRVRAIGSTLGQRLTLR